jgi:hypothetical protein
MTTKRPQGSIRQVLDQWRAMAARGQVTTNELHAQGLHLTMAMNEGAVATLLQCANELEAALPPLPVAGLNSSNDWWHFPGGQPT